jgi:hypothetical protein
VQLFEHPKSFIGIDNDLFNIRGFNDKFNSFFSIFLESKNQMLIKIDQIITKCICIEQANEVFLSRVVSLNEHDLINDQTC